MGRYRRVPIAIVLSLFVRPSIHVHEPILRLVHRSFAVLGGERVVSRGGSVCSGEEG